MVTSITCLLSMYKSSKIYFAWVVGKWPKNIENTFFSNIFIIRKFFTTKYKSVCAEFTCKIEVQVCTHSLYAFLFPTADKHEILIPCETFSDTFFPFFEYLH